MQNSVRIDDEGHYDCTPTYLFDYADLYRKNPAEAGLRWFAESRFGLAVNFGLHALLGKGQNVMKEMNISADRYENLKDSFKVEHFDATDIVQFAIAAGARYLEFTVQGPDGFCLWGTSTTDFNCVQSPVQRDFLGELASVCEYEGLGLCLRFSHGVNWRHEGSLSDESYFDKVMKQIDELLTNYGPIASLNLEGIQGVDAVVHRIDDIYKLVHNLQPQTLISYEQGINGQEDFFSVVGTVPGKDASEKAQGYIYRNMAKPVQIRESMTPDTWGYSSDHAGKHLSVQKLRDRFRSLGATDNYLLNVNLMPDGSLDLEDLNTLLELGKKIQNRGFHKL